MGLLMMVSASHRSIIHTVFVDPSENPFLDPYIEKVSRMNTKDIMVIPKMTDQEFLQYLHKDTSVATRGIAPRTDVSVFDPLRDDQLIHQTGIDEEWETLMVSGPIVVGYMGNLMVLASKKDFPFKAPNGYIYQYIKYPDSFRATLAQVSSDMYNALMGAHTAMDRIQLAIKQVPTHVKTAMKLITSASDAMLKSLLPRTLESVGRLATESADIANSTLLRFVRLQDLLAEIIELSANTQSVNEADIEQMKTQKENATLQQQRLKDNLESIKNQYNQSKTNLAIVRQKYIVAIENLKASSTPDIIQGSSSPLSLLIKAATIVFEPLKPLGDILNSFSGSDYKVDNTKFENAMKIAQIAREDLEKAEKLHNDHFLLQLAEQNELAKTMNNMALLDLSVLSTEEVVRLLLKAAEKINLIKEQWARMIQFFSKLAAHAHSTQQIVVKDFVEVIEQAQTDNLLVNPSEREFFIDILVPAATTIESGAHLLYTMAQTYYAVSSEYMINQIAAIGKMLLLQTDDERNAQFQQASNNTLTISLRITQLAQERHALYLQQTQTRQAEYTAYINSLSNFNLKRLLIQQ